MSDLHSSDLIDRILSRSQEIQRWNLFHVNDAYSVYRQAMLGNPGFYSEHCFVTIVITIETCFRNYMYDVIGATVFNANDILIMVHSRDLGCRWHQMLGNPRDPSEIALYSIVLSSSFRIQTVHYFCWSCANEFFNNTISTSLYLKIMNLRDLQTFRNEVMAKSVLPIVAVIGSLPSIYRHAKEIKCGQFLYQKREGTQPKYIECIDDHIFMENLGDN